MVLHQTVPRRHPKPSRGATRSPKTRFAPPAQLSERKEGRDPRTLAMRLIRVTGCRRSEIVTLPVARLVEHKRGGLCATNPANHRTPRRFSVRRMIAQ